MTTRVTEQRLPDVVTACVLGTRRAHAHLDQGTLDPRQHEVGGQALAVVEDQVGGFYCMLGSTQIQRIGGFE